MILTCSPSDGNSSGGVGLVSGRTVVQIISPEINIIFFYIKE